MHLHRPIQVNLSWLTPVVTPLFFVLLLRSLSQEYVPRSLLVPVTFPVIFAPVPFFTHFFTCDRWQS